MAKPARATTEEGEPVVNDELESGRMPFLSHLKELRDRVRNAAIAFMIAAIGCFYFSDEIFEWLKAPLFDVWHAKFPDQEPFVVFTQLTEPFWVNMSIALWAGIFASSPFIFFQLWKFVAPGLYKRERRIGVVFAIFSGIFFTAGAIFCRYLVVERLATFMLGFSTEQQKPMIAMMGYLDLIRDLMIAFGAVFELPLLIYFLAMVGMVTHRGLWKFNRWFIVIAFIIGAILTPTPDVPTQLMMAVPMIALYNFSILLAWQVTARREREAAAQRAKEAE
ncbi:MAG TPA: twin-arginine translocase subunit TatC [Kofleriaceae bacterium]